MADSLMDDPSSVKCFEDWMKTMVSGNQSKTSGGTVEDGDDEEKSTITPQIPDAGAPLSPESSPKAEDEKEIIQEVEPVSSKDARTPVVSVAHKATKIPATPAPKLASAEENKVDEKSEPAEPSTKPTSQKEILEKSSPRHDAGTPLERVSPKTNGLEDSIHARSTVKSRQYQHPLPPPSAKTPEEAPRVLKPDAGSKHDPMEFFDAKRKEYYPPPKAMLQSKDPNAPMAKKPATALNPKAKEYSVEVVREDGFDMTPMLNVLGARTKTPGTPPTVEVAIQKEGDDLEVDLGSLHGVRNVVFRFGCIHDAAAFRMGASGAHHP